MWEDGGQKMPSEPLERGEGRAASERPPHAEGAERVCADPLGPQPPSRSLGGGREARASPPSMCAHVHPSTESQRMCWPNLSPQG